MAEWKSVGDKHFYGIGMYFEVYIRKILVIVFMLFCLVLWSIEIKRFLDANLKHARKRQGI